ncbi:hypothetical protein CAEBREN_29987 [Caenorhabditis brenneri]|uniref:ABC transporter domain-containing protein n=1 Tax=Caenorhabditis brenneri TaxID=135651 RepID=G0P6E2_CAEBE|nr:hypothetical protein CAEBREN_29987 [Caenorhabditis brenneri]
MLSEPFESDTELLIESNFLSHPFISASSETPETPKRNSDASSDTKQFDEAGLGMVGFWRQLNFLLWKCVLVRRRQKFWLAVELIVPCILFIIIALVRTKDFSEGMPQCHYDSKGMLSAGFEELTKGGAEIIHWLAGKPLNTTEIIRIGDLFDAPVRENLTKSLNNTGLQFVTAQKLMNARIEPGAIEVYDVLRNELSWTDLLFSNPLFCDERMFEKTFSFDSGQEMTSEERDELCDILTLAELMDYKGYISEITIPTASRFRASTFMTSFQNLFEPSIIFFQKYSNYTTENLLLALFCGEDPRDVIEQTINPNNDKNVETPFEKLRKQVIKFIQTVTPGREQEKNSTCSPIPYHNDMNCSSLESPILMKVRAALSGYILVTPDNPATRRVVERLNVPLRDVEYLRNLLYSWPSDALEFQNRLHSSDLWPASQKLLHFISIYKDGQNPLNNKNIRFLLEHLFAPPTDEYSFGSFTKNVTEIANKYTGIVSDLSQMKRNWKRYNFILSTKKKEDFQNAVCLMESHQYFTGIVFDMKPDATQFDGFTTYKIRHYPEMIDCEFDLNSEDSWKNSNFSATTSFMDSRSNPFTRDKPLIDLKYLTFGFSFLQEAVDRAIISEKSNLTDANLGVYAQQEPYPCTVKDTFNVAIFMPLFLLISFIFPSALLVKNIVYEKEQKIKVRGHPDIQIHRLTFQEQMRAMGLGDAVHFVSWALISLVLNFISVLVISIISKVAKIFDYTDYTLLLFVLVLFLFSSIAMSLFFSTLFTNANIATAATCVLWFVFFIPFQLLRTDRISSPTFNRIATLILFQLLLPPTAMGHCFKLLESFNAMERASWSDLYEMSNPDLGVSVELCMAMLLVDTAVFLILLASDSFDSEPTNLNLTVHINSMSKVYENGTKALDCLNLRLYEGQITGLLGHNGAGKTTTMSILCGLYSPSSGTAKIYQRDIRTDLRRVRDVLGICPQHNVLFSHLTVSEQLRLFAALKGVPDNELDSQVAEILTSVSLTEKANKLASTLSGGMKRRLCIGIAFIGGSRFVILDEPTAGVDVTARKDIWKLLQRNKEGRTILLSTHHMDEADVLSDRIAILSQGQCITIGSSVFLKRRFGNHMTLAMVKEDSSVDYTRVSSQIVELGSDIGLEVGDENEEEIVFKIPIQTESDKLETFFLSLDENLGKYGLGQYGISAPTLQNIFVSLAPQKEYHVPKVVKCGWLKTIKNKLCNSSREEEQNDLIAQNPGVIENNMPQNNEIEEVKFEDFEKPDLLHGKPLIFQHFWALLVCRMNYTLKSKRTFLFQVIIPLVLLAIAELFVVLQVSSSRPDLMTSMPPLPLETSILGNHSDFYVNSWDTSDNSTATDILRAMFTSPGTGPRCAKDIPTDLLSVIRRELLFRNRYGWGRNMPPPGVKKDAVENEYECQDIKGEFDYTEDISNVTYNEPIYCGCEDFGWNCTLENWSWKDTPWIQLNTTDRIFDLSGKNLTQFRMITRNAEISNATAPFFLGGFSLGHVNQRAQSQADIDTSKNGWLEAVKDISEAILIINLNTTGIEPPTPKVKDPFAANITATQVIDDLLQNLDVKENVKVWFNNKIWPGLPITSNILSNALLRKEDTVVGKITVTRIHSYFSFSAPEDLGILAMNHPMNKTISQTLDQNALRFTQTLALFRITCLLLVLSMIPAGFTVYLVEDRICEAFHLQIVGGLRKLTYWITSYLYDLTVYTCVILVIMLIYVCFRVTDFTVDGATFFSFLLLFFMHGMSAILYAYVFQKMFSVPALSFVLIAIGSYFIGIVCALTVIMLETLMVQDPTLVPAHNVCAIVFLILPQYNLGIAIFRGLMIYQVRKIGSNFLEQINRPDMIDQLPLPALLSFDQMGIHVMCLFLHVILATICLIFSQMDEFGFVRKRERDLTNAMMLREPTQDEDEDVVKEKNRVDGIPINSNNYALVVRNLAKAYNPELLAVKGISFAVEAGECFGLLGLNGAGKTTTFSMLTAKIRPGHGSIEMQDTRINTGSFSDVRNFQQLGYCPQFDALNMKLSTRENLKFYARIRGIVPTQIDSVSFFFEYKQFVSFQIIDRLLVALHLRPYANTQTSSLSGGNRRKLSVAVALVSQPSLIFLDEPSAGMDPGSQQFLWKVIERLCKSGKAVVLTSHSMEECEALCTRIAIMDRGRIRCLGGKQHLKSKFGKGSMLTMKLGKDENAKDVAAVLITKLGQGSRIEAVHCSTVFIHIEQGAASVAKVLEIVNQIKKTYDVNDFTLSQSTLDNVFQSIAENQHDLLSSSDHSPNNTLSINRNNTASTYVINQ